MNPLIPQAAVDGAAVPIAAMVLLLATSFLFSGTESAYLSLQKPDRDRLSRGTPPERRVVALLQRRAALFTSVLLGNLLSIIGLAAIVSRWAPGVYPTGQWLTVIALTATLVSSAITAKILASRFSHAWATAVVWPLSVWFVVVTPIRALVSGLISGLGALLGVVDRRDGMAEEELMVYVAHGTATGELDPMERDIIESVFEFDELTVQRLMTPRPDVVSVPLTIEWSELLRRCREEGLSRVPVTGQGRDDIVGVLLVKDLLRFRNTPLQGPRQLRTLLLPPVFVPDSKPADGLLREFLERRFHMAFVVDEHGTFVGVVTLTDLLEELIGAGDDGTEDVEIAGLPDGMTVKASIDLEDFEEETGISLPEGDYHTLGGFVLHQLGRLPRRGETLSFGDNAFHVSRMDGRRVSEILVKPLHGQPPPAAPDQEAL